MRSKEKTVALELQPCCGERSGIGTYTWELAQRMQDRDGIRFHGNLFNFLGRNDTGAALDKINIPVNVNRMFPYGVYRRIWNYLTVSYDSLFRAKADLSVFFNYIVPPNISGRVITTIHDMTYCRYPETMDKRNLRRLRDGMEYSVKRSDRIITVSEFSKKEIMELLNVPAEMISVIPCAPNFSGEAASMETLAVKYGIKRPYILFVGNIEPRKNLTCLLRVFERLKTVHHIPHSLVIAGSRSWQTGDFDRALSESSVKDDILLTGFVSSGIKNALYKNASAFILTSLYEGFGIPPLEAMHFGCPVVCSNVASLPEVCGDAAVLVNPMDDDSVLKGMLKVLEDRDYADQLVQCGFDQISRFSWDASAEMLVSVCKEVLEI